MGKNLTEMTLDELWKLFPIQLVEHNDIWVEYYNEMESKLKNILAGYQKIRISHIGSTAIKGIWAKPIIDILLEAGQCEDINNIAILLEQNGFLRMCTEQNRISLNRGYTEAGFADKVYPNGHPDNTCPAGGRTSCEKVYHIHLRYFGDNDELYFRDYLNEFHEIAKLYERRKLSLWKKYEYNRDDYTAAKTDMITEYTKKAKEKYREKYLDDENRFRRKNAMSKVVEKFLRYVTMDTQSKDDSDTVPSTDKQKILAGLLADELKQMGAENVTVSEYSYVYATIPATTEQSIPVLGFVAHMDTAPAYSGTNVKPQIHKNYDGGGILMNPAADLRMSETDFPDLVKYRGQDIIATDGSTLLGADDKAGIAEIMTMAEYFLSNPSIPHGTIRIGFTPDEEVGRGADFFDVEGFGADVAYTVDGGELGELEYENFNAASAKVLVNGSSIHPGSSKGKMKNALLMGMELHSMLPVFENPMYTEKYEGFYHLDAMSGEVEKAKMEYIIRDHDMKKFQDKKAFMQNAVDYLNKKYGAGTFELEMKDSYYNMKEKLEPYMYLIDIAKLSMTELGIEPKICAIRGGTDGARLSYMGLPCPNLCTGGHNFHGKYEFIPVQSMEKVVELLIKIVENFNKR